MRIDEGKRLIFFAMALYNKAGIKCSIYFNNVLTIFMFVSYLLKKQIFPAKFLNNNFKYK